MKNYYLRLRGSLLIAFFSLFSVMMTMSQAFSRNNHAKAIASHAFPGDGRVERTGTRLATLLGNRIAINLTNSNRINATLTAPIILYNSAMNLSDWPRAGTNFAGNLDGVDCNQISGWVLNQNTPNQSTALDIYINGWLSASNVIASGSRQDIANAYGISGYNGFGFHLRLPDVYKVGAVLEIAVKYAGTVTHIPGSPKTTVACQVSAGFNTNCEYELARAFPESGQAISPGTHTNEMSLQLSNRGPGSIASLTSKLIPVNSGDYVSLDAYAHTPLLAKPNRTPQIATAIAGGIIAGLAMTQQQSTVPDQRQSGKAGPAIGLSTLTMLPLIKSLLADRLPKASMELAFYNKQGIFIHRQQVNIDKTARGDRQLLHVEERAHQEGYAVIRIENRSKTPVWFNNIIFRTNAKQTIRQLDTDRLPDILHTKNGFGSQTVVSKENVYLTTNDNCGGNTGGAIIDNWINLLDLGTTVTASRWPVDYPYIYYYPGNYYASVNGGYGSGYSSEYNPGEQAGGYNPTEEEILALPKPLRNANKRSKDDGCAMFKAMWDRQNNQTHVEQAAFITDKGIFWLTDEENTVTSSQIGAAYQYGGEPGSKWFVKDGVVYYIKATIHTHPVGDGWIDSPSVNDQNTAKAFGVPDYIISDSGIYKVDANGNNRGIVDYNYANLFNCNLDQNIVEELR